MREKELTKINCAKEIEEINALIEEKEKSLERLEQQYSEMSKIEGRSNEEQQLAEVEAKAERMAL